MKDLATPEELELELGVHIFATRMHRNITQEQLATDAGVSRSALRNLEGGKGSTIQTLVRVLKALDRTDWIGMLQPSVTISPLQMLNSSTPRQRARPLAGSTE